MNMTPKMSLFKTTFSEKKVCFSSGSKIYHILNLGWLCRWCKQKPCIMVNGHIMQDKSLENILCT